MRMRRIASRILTVAVLGAAQTVAACGTSAPPAHDSAPPGKIEALRQAQEKDQAQIEAEARLNALKAAHEQAATRREAEREQDDRAAPAR